MDLDADDLLEDVDIAFDTSEQKAVIELAMRMSEIVRSTSEWHRRMTSQKLSQSGKSIDYEALIPGAKVYFYKPPTAQEVERRGRKAKHLDHYVHRSCDYFKIHRNQILCIAIHGWSRHYSHLSKRCIHDLTRSIKRDKK